MPNPDLSSLDNKYNIADILNLHEAKSIHTFLIEDIVYDEQAKVKYYYIRWLDKDRTSYLPVRSIDRMTNVQRVA